MEFVEKSFGKMFICSSGCGPCVHPNYEPDTTRFIKNNLKSGMIFFDIGAHVGLFSIHAQQSGAIVHAFEAHPNNYEILKANAELYCGIIPHRIAVWNKEEKLRLASEKPLAQAYIQIPGEKTAYYEVQGRMLDDMTELPTPDFVKSDIQGAELFGLQGMQKRLLPSVKFLQVEVYPRGFRRYGYTREDLLDFLKQMGFKCISHTEQYLLTFTQLLVNAHFMREKKR